MKTSVPALLLISTLAVCLFTPTTALTRIRDSSFGKKFIIGFGENYSNRDQENIPSLLITVNTLDQETTVRIRNQTGNILKFKQAPFTSRTVEIDYDRYRFRSFGDAVAKPVGLEVRANEYVSVTIANLLRGEPSELGSGATATAVIPETNLGRDHILGSYNNSQQREQEATADCFQVVAAKDKTQVTVTLSETTFLFQIQKRVERGVPTVFELPKALDSLSICLPRGDDDEVYASLTGSRIAANKDVAVFGYNLCASVPLEFFGCDPIMEQIVPTEALGKETVVVPTATRPNSQGDVIRIVPAFNNTNIIVNGNVVATKNVGEYYEFLNPYGSFIRVGSSKPAQFFQYATARSVMQYPRDLHVGDPFMAELPAIPFWLSEYVVNTYQYRDDTQATAAPFSNYLAITMLTSAIGSVTINGLAPTTTWTPVTNSPYSATTVLVNAAGSDVGYYRVRSSTHAPMMVQVYGFGAAAGYGYNAGQAFRV